MHRVKEIAVLIILLCIVAKVLFWTLEPLLPLAIAGIGLIWVYSWLFKRKW